MPPAVPGTAERVDFGLAHRPGYAAVRLRQWVGIPGEQLEMRLDGGVWTTEVTRPAVDRMEYLFEIRHDDGGTESVIDPGNPLRVGGAFGDHSVVEFAGYRPPAWLDGDGPAGRREDIAIAAPLLDADITGQVWSSSRLAVDEPAPLLVVHDGPEYDQLAAMSRYAATVLAPLRLALLSPGHRDDWYSASGAYTRSLIDVVVPRLRSSTLATQLIGIGASLGALEMLVAHGAGAASFDALFLQSGSFFQRGSDDQERGFPAFERIVDTVRQMRDSTGARRQVPVVMTCGTVEENLANNRLMADALRQQGYPVALHEVRDAHNYTAWRDCLDPYLTRLVEEVCGGGR